MFAFVVYYCFIYNNNAVNSLRRYNKKLYTLWSLKMILVWRGFFSHTPPVDCAPLITPDTLSRSTSSVFNGAHRPLLILSPFPLKLDTLPHVSSNSTFLRK